MATKKILFTELGYISANGTNLHPWLSEPNAPVDLAIQQLCYEALFEATASFDWFSGVYWWAWLTDISAGGDQDNGFSPQNKLAQEVVEENYKSHLV